MKDLRVAANIAKAETLPPRAFTDPAVLALELERLFPREWLPLPEPPPSEEPRPWAERLAVRGARAPVTFLGKPLFLQRGWRDQRLRLLPNVCTHAWHPLVPGAGRGERLVCPQHGRQFDAQGRCLSQPGFAAKPGAFPRACDHLAELPTAPLGPLLLACAGKPRRAFAAAAEPIAETLARMPLSRLSRRAMSVEERIVDGNWKQHAWNYMDKFHVQFIHKAPGGLADAIDLASYTTELHEGAALQWAWARDPESGFDPAWLPKRFHDAQGRRVFALWWYLFPSTTLNFYPWGLSVNVYEPIPDDPERTLFRWHAWSWDDAKFAQRETRWLSSQVDAEDVEAMAQVRRGARSGLAPRGRFSPKEETGPHWFHLSVSRALAL